MHFSNVLDRLRTNFGYNIILFNIVKLTDVLFLELNLALRSFFNRVVIYLNLNFKYYRIFLLRGFDLSNGWCINWVKWCRDASSWELSCPRGAWRWWFVDIFQFVLIWLHTSNICFSKRRRSDYDLYYTPRGQSRTIPQGFLEGFRTCSEGERVAQTQRRCIWRPSTSTSSRCTCWSRSLINTLWSSGLRIK